MPRVKKNIVGTLVGNKGNLLGRKPSIKYSEPQTKTFTLADFFDKNPDVKEPSIRAFVKRQLANGRYAVVGKVNTGSRGKPAFKYEVADRHVSVRTVNPGPHTIVPAGVGGKQPSSEIVHVEPIVAPVVDVEATEDVTEEASIADLVNA